MKPEFVRYMLIEVGLVIVAAVIAALAGLPLGIALILLGVLIMTMPFVGSMSAPTSYGISDDRVAYNEIQQSLEMAEKRNSLPLLNPYVLAGLPLLLIGGILTAL